MANSNGHALVIDGIKKKLLRYQKYIDRNGEYGKSNVKVLTANTFFKQFYIFLNIVKLTFKTSLLIFTLISTNYLINS